MRLWRHRFLQRSSISRGLYVSLLSGTRSLGILILFAAITLNADADPVDWVNLYIGTGSGPVGYGRTMPFVTPPFGMTSWTPQTRQNRQGGNSYKYQDTAITGFMGTHQPALWMGDYGYVTLMPELDSLKTTPEERKLPFRHADELVEPDYYSVAMNAGKSRRIRTEMTATTRCAYLRFTFPASASSMVVVEASRPGVAGFVHVDAVHREITGYNPDRMDSNLGPLTLAHFKGYFVVQFRQGFRSLGTYPEPATAGGATGAYASFRTTQGEVIEARVGTSFLSIDQARKNLQTEIPQWNFNQVRQALRANWNKKLGQVTIDGASEDQRRIFYTALYHSMLYPRTFSEYGRYYSAFDDTIHQGESYTDYSIWDIFRAEFSLLTVLAPERINGMVQALLQDYQEGGWMPKWPNPSYTNIMISTHADSLVAEAINKHFHGFNSQLAWDAVYKDAMTPPDHDTSLRWADREPHTPYEARGGLTYLKKLGYIPNDKTAESASSTLEDSYDDWCVAQVAKALGKMDEYQFFLKRSQNYKNLFNPQTGFMQARNADGSWANPRDGWTEGSKWSTPGMYFTIFPGSFSSWVEIRSTTPRSTPILKGITIATTMSQVTMPATCTTLAESPGRRRPALERSQTMSTPTLPPDWTATTTAVRCSHGTSSLRSASIRSIPRPETT
jgi:predicted alpha-1,2-mannosidase